MADVMEHMVAASRMEGDTCGAGARTTRFSSFPSLHFSGVFRGTATTQRVLQHLLCYLKCRKDKLL